MENLRAGAGAELISLFGVKPTFTKESLKELEDEINKKFPVERKRLPTTTMPFGFYFGETLVKNYKNAKWVTKDAVDILSVGVKITSKKKNGMELMVYPFVRAEKFLVDRSDGFLVVYNSIPFALEKASDQKYLKEVTGADGWIRLPNNERMRITMLKKKRQ